MEYRKITAIIPELVLERVEKRLEALPVPGMTVTKVRGYGAYMNLFNEDPTVPCMRIEIFIEAARVDEVVAAIKEAARTDLQCGGIVAVLPVEQFHRIKD
jgi:nitrogen regulatory protein P-II 1